MMGMVEWEVVYIYIIYTPNLGLEITLPGREREQQWATKLMSTLTLLGNKFQASISEKMRIIQKTLVPRRRIH